MANNLINYFDDISDKKIHKSSIILDYLEKYYNAIIIDDLCKNDIRTIFVLLNDENIKLISTIVYDYIYSEKKEHIEIIYKDKIYNFIVNY